MQAIEVLLMFGTQTKMLPAEKVKPNKPLFEYPTENNLGLPPPTPAQMLHPMVDILPFPSFFSDLYQCLYQIKNCDERINQTNWSSIHNSEKQKLIKVIARKKVKILHNFLESSQGLIPIDGLDLIVPYVEELFDNELTSVPAVWSLFNLIGQEIGPTQTKKKFLPHLIKLFSGENASPKHMKIYHRAFLIQMILRLNMETFLSYFATLLVEAVSGYKNYVFEELYTEVQEHESFEDMPDMKSSKIGHIKFLPPVEEEQFLRGDNIEIEEEEESQYSELSSSDYHRETDLLSTQDEVDEIEDEIIDKLSLEDEDASDEDDHKLEDSSYQSSEENQDDVSLSQSEGDNGDNVDTASIHSISRLLGGASGRGGGEGTGLSCTPVDSDLENRADTFLNGTPTQVRQYLVT